MPAEMYLYRRHLPNCPHKGGGVRHRRCPCPIWVAGLLNGRQVRRTLRTKDWPEAARRMIRLESGKDAEPQKLTAAVEAWDAHLEIEPSTRRKYIRCARQLVAFCEKLGIEMVAEINVTVLDRFRASRSVARTTSIRELQQLRQFFTFCVRRGWIEDSPAQRIRAPKNAKPRPVVPYSAEDMGAIIAACGTFGKSGYERARARALILLMRHTGLRIGDATLLARDQVMDGEILLHTQKTGATIRLPLPGEVLQALECLPLPKTYGTPRQSGYFFWNGVVSKRGAVNMAERTLLAVFRKSGVAEAHAHRFRHTLAIEILTRGGSLADVARVLGNTAAIVERHYAPWCASYQNRITELMREVQSRKPVTRVEQERRQRRVM